MTNKEERPAGCVLRLFGVPEQTVQKAVETLPDTWQGTVHCRTRGAETLVALQSDTPQQLHRAVQQLRTSLAPALYGEGEQTLAAAAVRWNSTASFWCAAMPPPGRCWRPGWKTFPARKRCSILVL